MVSFGVAPGVIMYQILRMVAAGETETLETSIAWAYPAFLVPCFAAWRLAKFNIDTRQQYGFRGVPTPAVGLLIASFPLILYYDYFGGSVNSMLLNRWVLYAIIAILSFLMVSDIPIMSLKFRDYTLRSNLMKLVLVIVAIVAALVLKWMAVPAIFVLYIILSLAEPKKIVQS